MTTAPIPLPLRVESVRIRHEELPTFTPDGVSFDVSPGEVLLILGPSGSGKSTLALALNGLIPHAIPAELSGTVTVAGTDTTKTTVGDLSQTVSMVFQDPDSQIVTGTLLDEVAFGPENLLVPKAEVLRRAERALRRVGLWERRSENPDVLSGGGRQRLAIACALALGSPVIVLDEPTANLDPVGIEEVYAALAELIAEGDHAIVLVEHNLDAALELVDRVLVIDREGRLVLDGPARQTLTDNVDQLVDLGVWLPVSTLAALRLRAAGVTVEPLPLSPSELTNALDRVTLPAPPLQGADLDRRDPLIVVDQLSVTRGRSEVLHGVSLEIARGDFLAVVGENGAGKTTLLQAIAGVVRPPRGAVTVTGLDPATADVRALSRAIGFVFQNPEHQFIRNTVAEELAHGLEIQHLPQPEIDDAVERMLHRFGLTAHREQHPFLLSGGQKRRLSVGTALIAGAPVLALDEPTFGQDRERAAELLDMLAQLGDDGTTVIVVTHDTQLVADYTSHVAVMRDGRLLATDTTAAVLAGDLLEQAGLRHPPLARAMRALQDERWRGIARIADLP